MSKIFSVASGFQNSVNIAYDINRDDKLKNFIPTQSSLKLMGEILDSTNDNSTERARVLVGAYGRGKSHIMLAILSMLMKKERSLFEKANQKIAENPELLRKVDAYYENDKRIVPIVITGSSTSLSQSLLIALQRTLSDYDLLDKMPETNYKAAQDTINKWKKDYPDTYKKFCESIGIPAKEFEHELSEYNHDALTEFINIFPSLTSGSSFNPFNGSDVVELFEEAEKTFEQAGYSGIYIVYDEFGKYLEANIKDASVSDTKMLQDLAEKCNRSGKHQMHIILICHKEIANYIDVLPKNKVDGWRGVSERFYHIHLNNNFTQTYEVIASVIQHEDKLWTKFKKKHSKQFDSIKAVYNDDNIFADTTAEDKDRVIFGCYPLQPVSTFILPRLSERVAQNERTLFTFLSANGNATLQDFLNGFDDNEEALSFITPDIIYDYFEPLFKKEQSSQDLLKNYILSASILSNLEEGQLQSKIVKTIALIDILEQYDRLSPTTDEIMKTYSYQYTQQEISDALNDLIEKKYVIYRNLSNNFLRLKQSAGVDIEQEIVDYIERNKNNIDIRETLNISNIDTYIYPYRYNDERGMTRFFQFIFIGASELSEDVDWDIKSEGIFADGIVYGIIPEEDSDLESLKKQLIKSSKGMNKYIFVLPKRCSEIRGIVEKYSAITHLRENAVGDEVIFNEYDIYYQDLQEVLNGFISEYTHPELFKSYYISKGRVLDINRKAALTEYMSKICDIEYSDTPEIINEAINKEEPTTQAVNSRSKIIAGLLRNELEPMLGLSGSGQDVSIMRSTLIRTHILVDEMGVTRLDFTPDDKYLPKMFSIIKDFIFEAKKSGELSFDILYENLCTGKEHIGLRRGLVPIYLAAVFHEYRQELIITFHGNEMPLNSDTLLQINSEPGSFCLSFLDWDEDREKYISVLSNIFSKYIIDAEKSVDTYGYVASAMKRWYMNLPKYSKEYRPDNSTKKIKQYSGMIKYIKQDTSPYELLFEKLPKCFGYSVDNITGLQKEIERAKKYYDGLLPSLEEKLILKTKECFATKNTLASLDKVSLTTVINDFCDALDSHAFEQLFDDGTDRCLALFKTVTNDEASFIKELARVSTGLRINDWNSDTIETFIANIEKYKNTSFSYNSKISDETDSDVNGYELVFGSDDGDKVVKRFEKIEVSKRAKLLYNSIIAEIDSMGLSVSDAEKRQVLMDVLKQIC